jgi:predicted metal-dependent hydrolase
MSLWTKSTYEMVAEVIGTARREYDTDVHAVWGNLVREAFVKHFRKDNRAFDAERFWEAIEEAYERQRTAGAPPRRV